MLGSLPTGATLARRAGVDVRRSGSGNVGATNVTRTAGWRLGVLTLLADVLKGSLGVGIAILLDLGMVAASLAGLATVVGHLYPAFGRLQGGKGVATTLGVLVVLAPQVALAALAVFAAVVSATRIVSLGSMGAALVLPLALYLFGHGPWIVAVGAALALLILWRHRDNIARLRAGTEHKI